MMFLGALFVVALGAAMGGFALLLLWLVDLSTWWSVPLAMILGAYVVLASVAESP